MFLRVNPFDTLFFSTGRPMVIGVDTWSDALFPPSPSTFYGALRSFLIFNFGSLEEFLSGKHKYTEYLGRPENKKVIGSKLKIKGIYFFEEKSQSIYFLSPLDLVEIKEKSSLRTLKLTDKSKLFISRYSLENTLMWKGKEQVEEATGWLDIINFKKFLKNEKKEFYPLKNEEIFEFEHKVGIARDRITFTSKEKHLYRIPLVRLKEDVKGEKSIEKKVSFLIELEEIENFPERGIFQLGGEGKAVKFELLKDDPLRGIKNLNFNLENGYFKIYLATPAVFKNGWFPEWIKDNFEGEYNGIKVKLVACALGKPTSIGGWDMLNRKAKPMRKLVPPGSVYYFKTLSSASSEQIKDTFHLKSISDEFEDIEYSKEGFGIGILGEVEI